jgi:BirA family transcriptional regulator, biotin operon repressor / biotin---[acetyl-CoA-carboxylase] ligase
VTGSLAPEAVLPLLRGRFGRPYRYADVCTSTQRLLGDADPEGAVAATEEQTAGRGRLGRSWHAPRMSSILASIVLAPAVKPERLPELSLVAGEAVARAIADTAPGVRPSVRFPNDVLVDGRKVAGILAEASGGRVILGFGINANQGSAELPAGATSLRVATGARVDRAGLLASVLAELERGYDAWLSGSATTG